MTDQLIDQYTLQDPTKLYADRKPDEQYLEGAGTDAEMAQNVPAVFATSLRFPGHRKDRSCPCANIS